VTALARLQRWYKSNCDGEWEHAHGIRIQTLDNPGWLIDIEVVGTPMEAVAFERVEAGDPEIAPDMPWHECWRDAQAWHAGCSTDGLEEVLTLFAEWAEAHTL